ncbi:unnamed protein product [Sphenostylis stenocarpa]|uniref:Uncharacterized protein n=1 Tax=Sphenostylis stenocarpa TaxID=92480 RepID=A0AA86RY79_9FABA|nr:unnamed protein product [Sphenostylis stenocarpa]
MKGRHWLPIEESGNGMERGKMISEGQKQKLKMMATETVIPHRFPLWRISVRSIPLLGGFRTHSYLTNLEKKSNKLVFGFWSGERRSSVEDDAIFSDIIGNTLGLKRGDRFVAMFGKCGIVPSQKDTHKPIPSPAITNSHVTLPP